MRSKKHLPLALFVLAAVVFCVVLTMLLAPTQKVKVVSAARLLERGMPVQQVRDVLRYNNIEFNESADSNGETHITVGRDGFLESFRPNKLIYLGFREGSLVRASGKMIYGIDEGPSKDITLR